jgi:hypothetical protein
MCCREHPIQKHRQKAKQHPNWNFLIALPEMIKGSRLRGKKISVSARPPSPAADNPLALVLLRVAQ